MPGFPRMSRAGRCLSRPAGPRRAPGQQGALRASKAFSLLQASRAPGPGLAEPPKMPQTGRGLSRLAGQRRVPGQQTALRASRATSVRRLVPETGGALPRLAGPRRDPRPAERAPGQPSMSAAFLVHVAVPRVPVRLAPSVPVRLRPPRCAGGTPGSAPSSSPRSACPRFLVRPVPGLQVSLQARRTAPRPWPAEGAPGPQCAPRAPGQQDPRPQAGRATPAECPPG